MTVNFRACRGGDAAALSEIYNHYVRETIVTFEEAPIAAGEMTARVDEVVPRLPWLVAQEGAAVVGYAYARPWSSRSAYRFAVESAIYLAPAHIGRGIGSCLYAALIEELRGRRIRCVVGAIALPNPASVRLHEKAGFRKAGHLREIGWKLGRWVDVGYWELLL